MRLSLATCLAILGVGITPILPLGAPCWAESGSGFSLMSSAFKNAGTIPQPYTCSGLNKSPALAWKSTPSGVRSLALIVTDPDAPSGMFVHWVIYNIDPDTRQLPEGLSTSESVGNAVQGVNGRAESGYTGPCPPSGAPHHYHFRLYALDQKLTLARGANAEELKAAMKGHILATAELIGVFQR